ncbi:MAG: DNRLRE domain-containing protein [Clostridia bacterium]|nr:DNRLRE domain-containing protein [Clostridia bacterium]
MKKGIKLACKILSVFLSVLLVMQIAPMQIIADAYAEATVDENTENTLGVNLDDIDTTEPEAEILAEETSKREQYVKHFRMTDGSYRATQYEVPVHFIKNGEWTDYDNTLTEVDADTEDGEKASNKDLTNTLADYSVRLSKKTNGKKFVRIEKDGYKLSWYYTKANKVTAQITEITDDGDETTLEKLSSQVIYENVYTDTDFEYIIGSEGLKENIILKSKDTQTEFVAEYKANGLTPVQVNDKTIELRAEDGTVIYTINAPYMTDANMEYSGGITLTLSNVKNNKFTVTTTLDEDWLNDNERAYPVTVDPHLTTSQEWEDAACSSAYIASSTPSTCYGRGGNGYEGSLYVGYTYGRGKTRSLIKMNELPELGVADKVIYAEMAVWVYACYPELTMNLHNVTKSWNTSTVCWNSNITYDSEIIDYQVVQHIEETDTEAKNRWQRFEITDLVRGWYSGEIANNGVLLRSDKETSTTQARARMLSAQYPTYATVRPVFDIHYRNMSGYEDYWSYTGVSAGRNGAVSVNNFNGNAVFTQPITMGDGGNLMPVSLSLVYNSNGLYYLDANKIFSYMGGKMQTNFHIYLGDETDEQLLEKGYKHYLNDADGTKHWFYFEKDVENTAKDEDGLGYTLDIIEENSDPLCDYTNGDDYAKFRITDKNDTKMYFNTSGNLIQITDSTENSAKVVYVTVNNKPRIDYIEDGAGRRYTFNYGYSNNSNLCTSITDPVGRTTTFNYSTMTMTSVKFPDGKTVSLSYSDDFLTTVTAIDGTRTKIAYDSTSQKRVSNINWGTSDSSLLESYSFAYKQNETTITERVSATESRTYTYQFNDFGQTTGIVSNKDGNAQYFEYTAPTEANSPNANKLVSQSKVINSVTNYVINPDFYNNLTGYTKEIASTTGSPTITVDTTKGNLTKNSLKVYKPSSNTTYAYAIQRVTGLPTGTYTFSCYANTEGATISGGGIYVGYKVLDTNGNFIEQRKAEDKKSTDGWERMNITFDVTSGETVWLLVGLEGGTYPASGTVWFDDLQLEKSAGVSSYNLLENSGFSNNKTSWSNAATLKTLDNNELPGFTKAISKVGSPTEEWLGLSQFVYPNNGKKDDVFSIGSWIKADSAPINNLKDNGEGEADDDRYKPRFALALHFYNSSDVCIGTEEIKINDDLNTWQFVSGKVIAPADYSYCCFEVIYYSNVNTVMMTGGFCYREEFGQTYTYDKDGNVVSSVDLANTESNFAYFGDQMAKMLNPSGSRYLYSYDEQNKLNYALSSDGQEYGFEYDDKGNVTSSEITARKPATTLEAGKEYIIVNAYSGKALDSGNQGVADIETVTSPYNPESDYQCWKLVSSNTSSVYKIYSAKFPSLCLDISGNVADNGKALQIFTPYAGQANQNFKILANGDGTFTIYTGCSSYAKAVDACYEETDLEENSVARQNTVIASNPEESCRWYFYPVEETEDKTISTSATYTDNKNFVSTMTDQRGNTTTYNYNQNKGTLTSVTDAKNNTTSYVYNANTNALQSVTSGGMTNSYTYNNDRLTEINVNGSTRYRFLYDAFGRTTATQIGNGSYYYNLSTLEYNNAGLLSKQTYGNGDFIEFGYDNLDRLINKSYNGSNIDRAQYFYGSDGNITRTIDYSTNTDTKFVYDLAGRLVSVRDYRLADLNYTSLKAYVEYTYADKTNYLTGVKHYNALGTQNIGYRYGNLANGEMPDAIYGVTWNGNNILNYSYDGLGRLNNKSIILNESEESTLDTTYTYYDVNDTKTTTLLKSISTEGVIHNYQYDELGNITSIVLNSSVAHSYEYDDLNQLVRENNYDQGKTFTYEYSNGNIIYKHEYDYTTGALPETPKKSWQYHYGYSVCRDILTGISEISYIHATVPDSNTSTYSLNNTNNASTPSDTLAQSLLGDNYRKVDLTANGVLNNVGAIHESSETTTSTYSTNATVTIPQSTTAFEMEVDGIGNMTKLNGFDFNWNGRRLESISQDGTELISYEYNIDGQRVKKTAPDLVTGETVTTEYFYNGDILAGQKKGNDIIIFMYDNNGDIFGFTYNGTPYYYVKNAQNDVFLIVDEAGEIVVLYQYDAWGKVTACYDMTDFGLSAINTIMYRSYYVDLEMGMFMYYLNSRYYMADWGRFISADSVVSEVGGDVLGYNMFAYCQNNPVNYCDPNGNWLEKLKETAKKVANWVNENIVEPIISCFYVKYDVPVYNQGSTNLCWAYSQAMIEDAKTNTSRTHQEANDRAKEIAIQKHGEDDWNKGSNPNNLVLVNSSSLDNIRFALRTHGPLYAVYGYYDVDGNRVKGHAVVITGVNMITGQVYTNNPWGISGSQEYEDFLCVFLGEDASCWKLEDCYYLS